MRNQRFVQAMGIPGLFTGLMTIVDFKGERYLAQTVVPGVLSGVSTGYRMKGFSLTC
jgi:hypothetical protein